MNDRLIPAADVAALPASGVRRLTRPQRLAATALLAFGLLGVGGVALVHAADSTPTPSASSSTTQSQTTQPNSNGGTPRHSGQNCPNMNGSSSSSSTSTTTSGSN